MRDAIPAPEPAVELPDEDQRAELDRCLAHLSPREQDIIRSRAKGHKLFEIGDRLGITRERVGQIEQKAMGKLARRAMGSFRGPRDEAGWR